MSGSGVPPGRLARGRLYTPWPLRPSALGETSAPRTFLVAALFTVILAAVGNAAWIVSVRTEGLSFSEGVSTQAYAITFALGSILACGIVTAASVRALELEEALRLLRAGIAALDRPSDSSGPADLPESADVRTVSDGELDDLLEVLETSGMGAVVGSERAGHDALADDVRGLRGSGAPRQDVVARFKRNRDRIRAVRDRVWRLVAGPLAAATLFVGLAGAMLPASSGGPLEDPRLNAAALLFLAFGWPILAGWSAVALTLGKTPPELTDFGVPG